MVVIVFRARARPGVEEQFAPLGARMDALVRTMPGFISAKDFTAGDGEGVTIVEFESLETLEAWRDHPEHRAAQEQGRRELLESYRVQVCELLRESRFDRPQ